MKIFRQSLLSILLSSCTFALIFGNVAYANNKSMSQAVHVPTQLLAQSQATKSQQSINNPEYNKLGAVLIQELESQLAKVALPVVIRMAPTASPNDIKSLTQTIKTTHVLDGTIYANISYAELKQLQANLQVLAIDMQGTVGINPPSTMATPTTPPKPSNDILLDSRAHTTNTPTTAQPTSTHANTAQTQSANISKYQQNLIDNFRLFTILNQLNPQQNFGYSLPSIEQTFLAALLAMQAPLEAPRPSWLLPTLNAQTLNATPMALPNSYKQYNQLFYRQGQKINKKFETTYTKSLLGKLIPLNFSNTTKASQQANATIKTQSQGLIDNLFFPEDFHQSDAIFSNVLYFKANWEQPFDASLTQLGTFTTSNNQTQQVPMMSQSITTYTSTIDGWQYISLPFADDSYLQIFLTPEGQPSATPNADIAWRLISSASEKQIELRLPKLHLASPVISLSQIMPELSQWKLNGLIDGKVSGNLQAKHQAIISWDEVGAEAAAATAIATKRSLTSKTQIIVNRPFVFNISYQDSPMFTGMVRQLPQP